MSHVVVVGAGQAAASLVARLRSKGFDGQITVVGEEPAPPYQRPPLSKAYLLGDMELDRLFLRPAAWYADNDVTLRLGTRVDSIRPRCQDRADRRRGACLRHARLDHRRGAEPAAERHRRRSRRGLLRAHPGRCRCDGAGVSRRRPGADRRRRLHRAGSGGGGGEEGAEGHAGRDGRPDPRSGSPPRRRRTFSATCTRRMASTSAKASGSRSSPATGRVTGAALGDGTGARGGFRHRRGRGQTRTWRWPNRPGSPSTTGSRWTPRGAPPTRASGPRAIAPRSRRAADRLRLESVGNAIDMGELVAENMMGAGKAYVARPWFWSDQYDVKLQIAGLGTGYDEIVDRPRRRQRRASGTTPATGCSRSTR